MKTRTNTYCSNTFQLAILLLALSLPAQVCSAATAGSVGISAFEGPADDIGPDHRSWRLASADALGTPQGAHKVELETGMNYWNGQAWAPSQPAFEITNKAFIAQRVQHRAWLSGDLNTPDAVRVTTPDGLLVQSTPVAIALYDPVDGSETVIGTLTNSFGVLVNDRQVIYENCFNGVCADVSYSIDKSSFAQDVGFTGRLNPADYGFSPSHPIRIEIWTELYQAPQPDVIKQPLYVEQDQSARSRMASPDVIDETIGFGEFVLGRGAAYTVPTPQDPDGTAGIVAKELVKSPDGRVFLVESVGYDTIAKGLQSLPDCNPAGSSQGAIRRKNRNALYASIPKAGSVRQAQAPTRPPSQVLARSLKKPSVTIDYIATIGGTLSSATVFQSDTNWFISGAVVCNGQVTIEGGTIFKYKTNASLRLNSTLICKTSIYRPAIFTGVDDDTVGDSFTNWPSSGYTGTINTSGYANPAIYMGQSSLTLSNCWFRYAQQAVRFVNLGSSATLNLHHSQLVKCIRGIEIDSSGCGSGSGGTLTVNLNNTLLAGTPNPIMVSSFPLTINLNAANCTFDQVTKLIGGTLSGSVVFHGTNSVFANITNSSSGVTFAGNCNGFYSDTQNFGTSQNIPASSPFQTAGAGNYYLTDASGFRNFGTASSVPAWLVADLGKLTTYPPIVLAPMITNTPFTFSPQAQRDTDTLDLGYHYAPLDYEIGGLLVTNATVTINPGAAIGIFATNGYSRGLAIGQNGVLQCQGTPNRPNWIVQYPTVQEQPLTTWFRTTNGMVCSEYQGLIPGSTVNFRFTDWSVLSLDAPAFNGLTNSGPLNFQDCEFRGGKVTTTRPTINLTNCLLERVYADLEPKDGLTTYVRNCLVYGQTFIFAPTNSVVRDNLFDKPTISNWNGYVGGTNAYVTNFTRLQPTSSGDILLSVSPSYQAGPLGAYYLPNNSSLINAETHTSADQVDLYQYTVCTNLSGGYQIKETNSWTDVTYHYVATDANGNPQDSDGDGIPDYLEDANGNGNVDSGETDWKNASDLGLKVLITKPKNNSVIP